MEEDQNNAVKNTPSTDSNSMPKGGNIFQKGKNVAVKTKNGIRNGIARAVNELWNRLTLKQKAIFIAVIVAIALVIITAALLMSMISETSTVASDNVDNYIASTEGLDDDAKQLFEDKSSLIGLKISDINEIYNKLIIDNKGGSETQVLMQYEIGENEVKDSDKEKRIVNVSDKLPLYKHILMTEKYNFNLIKWQKFSHSGSTAGEKVENLKEDKEKGLKYPDDSKFENGTTNSNPTKLDKFIDLTLPYLQTWYIPLAMSNASIVSGAEKDSNRSPQFSYNIIKEAYSNIIVNWYELKEHTLITRYQTYDEVKYHYIVNDVQVIETTYENGRKSYSFRSYGNAEKKEDSRVSKNTATTNGLADGTKDPMKEEYVSESDKYKSNFYIKEADVFDCKIINSFNYKVYSESDVEKRTNPKSKSESTATYARAADNPQNRYSDGSIYVNENGTPYVGGVSANVSLTSAPFEISTQEPISSVRTTKVYTYSISLPQYTDYENGLEHTVTRIWKDTLEQSKSETLDYTIDDLIAYNQSGDRNKKVSAADLCGENYSGSSSSGSISEGTSSPTSEIKIGNYTYPVFAQGDYGQTKHGGDTIAEAGCGLCSLTTVVGGITSRNVDPISCGNDIGWTCSITLEDTANKLKSVYNIDATATVWANKSAGGISVSEKEQITKASFKENLSKNNPIIALIKTPGYLGTTEAHYVAIVGIEGDTLIIANSAGGVENRENIDTFINAIFENAIEYECGFVVAKRSESSSSSSSSSTSSSSSSSNSSQSSNNSTSLRGTGQSSETTSDVNSTGYTGIFTSGTTGRKFKNFKQNGNTYIDNYSLSSSYWGQECGTVSIIICGSGYSDQSNFSDAANKLNSNGGLTYFTSWLEEYSGTNVAEIDSPSQAQLVRLLQDGCVAVIHDPGYSIRGHYMAVLDISNDGSQIYVSNPDMNNNIENGWNPISIFYNGAHYLEDCYFVPNEGNVADYSSLSDSSSNGTVTTCNGTESGKYYTQLQKTDGLNRIDFMNSNPDIFHRYIREGGEYLKYVGYARSKLNLSYWNLKNLFQKVYEKHGGSLPWAYGKTLGFENIYNSSGGNLRSSGGGRFRWPVPEYVEAGLTMWEQLTSTFGNRTHPITGVAGTMHNGIDIAAGVNGSASITAADSGKVVKASDTGDGYGNCVIIQHSDNYYTLYGHMAPGSLKVNVGDEVTAGQQIGVMGTTGNSTGNHLHFEITKIEGEFSMSAYYTSTRMDPCDFFNDDCSPIGGGLSGPSGLDLSVEEIKDFARMIYGEAGGNTYELQVACAAAAINQYKDHKEKGRDIDFFEDLIHDYWNFNGYNSSFVISESDSVYKAAVAALSGEDPTGGALYFYDPAAMSPPGPSAWHESLTYLCTIDGTRFFKP